MSLPTAYKVEIAFNAGVTTPAASRTWTDVTQWAMFEPGIDIGHGRADWRGATDANTLRLTLNNSDGRFTAGLASSPYYPNVKLGRPIRVTATLGSASTRYVGFIDEWPVEWPATVGTFATATISATSRLAWLGNRVELLSIIEQEILLDDPVAYYTLGEAAGAVSASDTSGNNAPALTQTGSGAAVVFGNATGPGTDGLTAAQFTADGNALINPAAYTSAVADMTLDCFFSMTAVTASSGSTVAFLDAGALALGAWTDGRVYAKVGASQINSAATYLDGSTHHLAIAYDNSTTNYTAYLDGVSIGTATAPAGLTNGLAPFMRSIGGSPDDNGRRANITGVIAHAASFNSRVSAARILAHANAGLTGFTGETPAARITRYASYAGIAAAEVSAETGMVPDLAHIDTTGKAAVDCMRIVEATEEGVLFDGRDGLLTFHARNHRYSAASAFTLNVPTGQVDVGLSPRLDRSAMRNDVSAATSDGTVSARAVNQPSIDDYGPARESLDLATANAEEPFQHASWLVNSYGSPIPRVPQLGVKLANLPSALAQAVLAAGVGTRFTVTGMPSQAESSSQDYYIEGYSERMGPGYHDLSFNVSQAEPFDVWTVEDPVLGQYDAYPIAL